MKVALKKTISFQCKYWQKSVTNKAVQEVFSGLNLYGCHKGAVITNNSFAKSAIELARANDVILLEGRTPEMMIEVIKECDQVPCINTPSNEASIQHNSEISSNNTVTNQVIESNKKPSRKIWKRLFLILMALMMVELIIALIIGPSKKVTEKSQYLSDCELCKKVTLNA